MTFPRSTNKSSTKKRVEEEEEEKKKENSETRQMRFYNRENNRSWRQHEYLVSRWKTMRVREKTR